jgi:hypothetical protein
MQDLEDIVYAIKYNEQLKADDPFLTTTTGLSNTLYGIAVWHQLNYDKKPLQVLPSNVYTQSGFNTKTSRATTGSEIWMGESSIVPDVVKGEYMKIKIDPKILAMAMGESLKQTLLAETNDDTIGGDAFVRSELAREYEEKIPERLMADMESAVMSADYDYTVDNMITPYDKMISSDAEEDALGGTYNGRYDCYVDGAMDRDSSTAYDSVVITCNESDTIGGTNGTLEKPHFVDLLQQIETNSGMRPSAFLTSYEVRAQIQLLYDGDLIYTPSNTVSGGLNGVESGVGLGVQYSVATIDKIPVIGSKYSIKNSSDSTQASKILAITTDPGPFGNVMELSVLYPTVEMTSGYGLQNKNHDLINRTGLITLAEAVIHEPIACGKITDIAKIN